MDTLNKQKAFFNVWPAVKLLWLAQFLAVVPFGLPLIAMTLFAANITSFAIIQTSFFYLAISIFIYFPLHGILPIIFLRPIRKILKKSYEKSEAATKEEIRIAERFFNSPLRLSAIIFALSFLGFIFGIIILRRGVIPELMSLIEITTVVGLAIGFLICLVQSSFAYVFLETYCRPKIEILNRFHPKITRAIKIIKFPLFWKIFLLALSSAIISQVSLWSLYLGRVIIYSPDDIKDTLIYVSVVAVLTLFYVMAIAMVSSRNLVSPLKKLILWADKIIKKGTKEEIALVTNDEITEVIKSLKRMHEELENSKASLEIKIKARTKELEELTERQEETIKERVGEVQKRAVELERFQKLAVGRELKMIELKKEIKKLRESLKK